MESDKKYITAQELKAHNKPGDIWICVNDKVYNVSDWAKEHPGGEIPLLNLAGQDVTDYFIAYHTGTAWQYLPKFFTGYHLKDFQVSEVSKDYRRIVHEFSKSGMFEMKGHTALCSLTSVAIMFLVVLYGVLSCHNVWAHLSSAMLLGMLWMQSAYVGHDSGHYQVMAGRGYNKLVRFVTGNCLTGISIAWWKWTYNAHHIACNCLDYDPDLQHIFTFIRFVNVFVLRTEVELQSFRKVSHQLPALDVLSRHVCGKGQFVRTNVVSIVFKPESPG
ncbi:Delta(8)-fatty-acid desaturase [Hibiscus syriacus]|uniref:Delta(8)-fatty-acid desaturase n=1 Tax=Hibiscus syriacus TaxID=106335 RepID=A0A6A3AGH6_HIBSY|nr:Delta(8)-fatty-acid desaturase [Hibiscus syriacus]